MTEVTQPPQSRSTLRLQPLLHELVSVVAAPGMALSAADGQIDASGPHPVCGWYVGDRRALSRLRVAVEGSPLEGVGRTVVDAGTQVFTGVARGVGDAIPDPTVTIVRTRRVEGDRLEEVIEVASTAQDPVEIVVVVEVAADLAPMAEVKQGDRPDAVAPEQPRADSLTWCHDGARVEVVAAGATVAVHAGTGHASWRLHLGRGESRRLIITALADVEGAFARGVDAERGVPWAVEVESVDTDLARTVRAGLRDLEGLLLREGDDRFIAAGSPWFLTLFGRDSLWAARLLMPVAAELAVETLTVLARRQGRAVVEATEEQPGKILHEVRTEELVLGDQRLAPVYFGTVDATPLWVCTLADAHEWGVAPERIRALVPALRGCLAWLLEQAGPDGWLRYVDTTGHGLSNQGWKDSHDSVQFADGRLAEPAIALVEVQAYAYEAAVRGARLLADLELPEVPGLLEWAERLRERFLPDFWVGDLATGHLAIALDGAGRQVDSVTSNMGHVLGTGLLPAAYAARIAELLADRRLDSGFGLRTLSSDSPRFSRLSYHGGSVWPHDTAIAVRGLAAEGHADVAARLAAGLFRAAPAFEYRLPELYGGDAVEDADAPLAYPAACRPQAWAAAAPLAALLACAGLRPAAGDDGVEVGQQMPRTLAGWRLDGIRHRGRDLSIDVDVEGRVRLGGR